MEDAIKKIKEEERGQEGSETKYKFFAIEIQTMTVTDNSGDVVFNNRVERKV